MRTLLYLFLLLSAAACKKEQDDLLTEVPAMRKIEWHVHAAKNYTEPWIDSLHASVKVRIYKIDTINRITTNIWDTTFVSRRVKEYPVLPQKHRIEKLVPVYVREKLQVWYNIRYEADNGSASETGRLYIVQKPFTFVDISL